MEPSGSYGFDIFAIFARYCDITSINDHLGSREALAVFSRSLESRGHVGDKVFEDLLKLMLHLNLVGDSHQFMCFYDFVFFICRENGQKSITVNRAITAWKLVLTGRFRLLNHWCAFVEKHHRHNISQDTWQQVLAFSRCVNEDLEGYDPTGAWPVLIDDFVEHMYRINEVSNCCLKVPCYCDGMEQRNISHSFHGLNLLPGSKRKCPSKSLERVGEHTSDVTSQFSSSKRPRQENFGSRPGVESSLTTNILAGYDVDANAHKQFSSLGTLTCAVEDNLSKVFEGHLSVGRCLQLNQKSGVSFT